MRTTEVGPDATTTHALGWRLGFLVGLYVDPAPARTLVALSKPVYNWHFAGSRGAIDSVRDHDPELRADVGLGHAGVLDVHKRLTLAGSYGTSSVLHLRGGDDAMNVTATQKSLFGGLTVDWRASPGYVLSEGFGISFGPSYSSVTADALGSVSTLGLEVRIHAAFTPFTWVISGVGGLCNTDPKKCTEFMADYQPTVIEQAPATRHEECSDSPGPNGSTVTTCRMVP